MHIVITNPKITKFEYMAYYITDTSNREHMYINSVIPVMAWIICILCRFDFYVFITLQDVLSIRERCYDII